MGALTIPERITKINNAFTKIFTKGMQSIEPVDRTDPEFDKKHKAWQLAFEFPRRLNLYINNFANTVVLAGKNNNGKPEHDWRVTKDFTDDLNRVLNSSEFDGYMEIVKPNLPNDSQFAEKIKAWEKAFDFVKKVRAFIKDVERAIDVNGDGYLTGAGYYAYVISLVNRLESK